MSLHRLCVSVFGFGLLFAGIPLKSQMTSQSWHVESTGDPFAKLVNDSDMPIEAVSSFLRCFGAARYVWHNSDALLSPSLETSSFRSADGRYLIGLKPGNSMNLSDDRCGVQVDAVIFADGRYEGSPDSVRAIQAGRDGILASVNYWLTIFSKENPDDANFAALKTQAENRHKQDSDTLGKFSILSMGDEKQSLSQAYWYGRTNTDLHVRQMILMDFTGDKATERYQHYVDRLTQWKKKIETDVSRENLRAEFPPVTEDSVKPDNLAAQQ
jgi:hypothetical protein